MTDREWKSGPPPHIGWWNASVGQNHHVWRWWDGKCWSQYAFDTESPETAAKYAAAPTVNPNDKVCWTDYYPPNARVPRVDPTKPRLLVLDELARIPRIKASDFGTHMKPLLIDSKRLKQEDIAMPQVDARKGVVWTNTISQMAEKIDSLTEQVIRQKKTIANLHQQVDDLSMDYTDVFIANEQLKEELQRLSHRSRYDSTTYVDTLGNRQHVPGCHATAVFAELRLGLCLLDQEP